MQKTGPLAIASGARLGRPAPRSLSGIFVLDSDLAVQFNNGNLRSGLNSTVLEADETGVRVLRIGAISLEAIQKIVPGATGL